MVRYEINLSGYDIICGDELIYFGYMPNTTDEEKRKVAEEKLLEFEGYVPTPKPLPTLSETDEAILNTNANVEYLVALKELEV